MPAMKHTLPACLLLACLVYPRATVSAQGAARLPDRRLKQEIGRLADSVDDFSSAVRKELKGLSGEPGKGGAIIVSMAEDLRRAAARLKDSYDGDRNVAPEVQELYRRAVPVNGVMEKKQVLSRADREWSRVKQGLDLVGRAFNIRTRFTSANVRPYRLNDSQVVSLIESIRDDTDNLREEYDRATRRDRNIDRLARENLLRTLKDFRETAQRARGRVSSEDSGAPQVMELLRFGATIDRYISRSELPQQMKFMWSRVARSLTELGKAYGVSWRQLGI